MLRHVRVMYDFLVVFRTFDTPLTSVWYRDLHDRNRQATEADEEEKGKKWYLWLRLQISQPKLSKPMVSGKTEAIKATVRVCI